MQCRRAPAIRVESAPALATFRSRSRGEAGRSAGRTARPLSPASESATSRSAANNPAGPLCLTSAAAVAGKRAAAGAPRRPDPPRPREGAGAVEAQVPVVRVGRSESAAAVRMGPFFSLGAKAEAATRRGGVRSGPRASDEATRIVRRRLRSAPVHGRVSIRDPAGWRRLVAEAAALRGGQEASLLGRGPSRLRVRAGRGSRGRAEEEVEAHEGVLSRAKYYGKDVPVN